MKIVKAKSALGKRLIEMGTKYDGKFLNQIYDKWSKAKEEAWNKCYNECIKENGEQFGICSHNSYNFVVSWFVGNTMRVETSHNSYLVIFDD